MDVPDALSIWNFCKLTTQQWNCDWLTTLVLEDYGTACLLSNISHHLWDSCPITFLHCKMEFSVLFLFPLRYDRPWILRRSLVHPPVQRKGGALHVICLDGLHKC
jgi:hypothetical protein